MLPSSLTTSVWLSNLWHLASAKAPVPDGYTVEFYKLTNEFLPDTPKHVYSAIWDGGPYLPTGTH